MLHVFTFLTSNHISKLAPYELVQSVIRSSDVTPHLRASFCDLLLNISVNSFINYYYYLTQVHVRS